ncbi:hypothetical protein [Hahella ganghwensis]|uniref:hypothetical protein n=1 Tax=Hahella ganghwensis TaxID=286420 RepID=UPI003CCBC8FB
MRFTAIILTLALLWSGVAGAETVLRISVGNWEPYIGQDLPDEGMAAVILRESLANVGYDVELVFCLGNEPSGRPRKATMMPATYGLIGKKGANISTTAFPLLSLPMCSSIVVEVILTGTVMMI